MTVWKFERDSWRISEEELRKAATPSALDRALWVETVAEEIAAGNSQIRAFEIAFKRVKDPVLKALSCYVLEKCWGGATPSEALCSFPHGNFPTLSVLATVGEWTGQIEVTLKRVAAIYQEADVLPKDSPITGGRDHVLFYAIAVGVGAGFSVLQSIEKVRKALGANPGSAWDVVPKLYEALNGQGRTFSEALGELGFDKKLVAVVSKATDGGNLTSVMADLTGYQPR